MSRSTDAYAALHLALNAISPGCKDDAAYIADDLAPHEAERLAAICAECPVFDLCADYARLDKPTAGIWAGQSWKPVKRTKKSVKSGPKS